MPEIDQLPATCPWAARRARRRSPSIAAPAACQASAASRCGRPPLAKAFCSTSVATGWPFAWVEKARKLTGSSVGTDDVPIRVVDGDVGHRKGDEIGDRLIARVEEMIGDADLLGRDEELLRAHLDARVAHEIRDRPRQVRRWYRWRARERSPTLRGGSRLLRVASMYGGPARPSGGARHRLQGSGDDVAVHADAVERVAVPRRRSGHRRRLGRRRRRRPRSRGSRGR